MRILMVLLFALAAGSPLAGQIVRVVEAETCDVKLADSSEKKLHETFWASGESCVANGWGGRPGDEIRWTFQPTREETKLRLAVRYGYDRWNYLGQKKAENKARKLHLIIDEGDPMEVDVPHAGGWDDFTSAYVDLPKLSNKPHTFVLRSPATHMATNVDAFTFFRGEPEKVLPLAHRGVVTIRSTDGRFGVRMSPKAEVKHTPEKIVENFQRIYAFFKDHIGWEPDRKIIYINIIEDRFKKGTFENLAGVHFEASNFNWDRGNWMHEMNHIFHNRWFPEYIDHPIIRVNDTFVVGKGCFPEWYAGPAKDPNYRARLEQGRKLVNNPGHRTDDSHEILYALNVKYGAGIVKKFYVELEAAEKRGELKLQRDRPINKEQIVACFSRAAGEDVRKIFEQWNGFAAAK